MTFDRFDVVVVPFPFTEQRQNKRRPALVLSSHESFGRAAGHSILAMITSAANPSWPLDIPISDPDSAGLHVSSVVRLKLFTLDHRIILRKTGTLSQADCEAVEVALKSALLI